MDRPITETDLTHAGVHETHVISLPGEDTDHIAVDRATHEHGEPDFVDGLFRDAGPHEPIGLVADPTDAMTPPTRRAPSRRIQLLATAGVAGALICTGLWIERGPIASLLGTPHAPATIPVAAGMPAAPQAAVTADNPAPRSGSPNGSPPSHTTMTDFASLQSLPGPAVAEVGITSGVVPKPAAASHADLLPTASTNMSAGAAMPAVATSARDGLTEDTSGQPASAIVSTATQPLSNAAAAISTAAPPALLAPVTAPLTTAPLTTAAAAESKSSLAATLSAALAEAREQAADPKPITQVQQTAIVDMVKQLSAQLRETRLKVTELSGAVALLTKTSAARANDLESRLEMVEAGAAVAASGRAGASPADAASAASGSGLPSSTVGPASSFRLASNRPSVPTPPPPAPDRRTVKDYIVKGASPGLAVLSALNPESGMPAAIEVAIGDAVPGVGHVKSIFQRGVIWIVKTDAGDIQQ